MPLLAKDLPAGHPGPSTDLAGGPRDHDLPIANPSFTWNPPYYPGYEDLWENIFLGRLAAHPWGGRCGSSGRFIGGGLFDQYPRPEDGRARMRLWLAAVLGPAHGTSRRSMSAGTAPLQAETQRVHDERAVLLQHRAPRRRGKCSNYVSHFLGEGDVLMYASDYPHSECQFPDSI